jgi:cell division septation protein DedD
VVATLAQQVALAGNRDFSARLIAAAVTVALDVLAEPETVWGNAGRRSLALGVLGNPTSYEVRLAYAVLTDPATFVSQAFDPTKGKPTAATDVKIDATADKDLLTRLRAVWTLVAGVPPQTVTIPGGDLPPAGVG